ncbi:MAG: ArnT family glycosyltransferase [Blastocatellia bacterium]
MRSRYLRIAAVVGLLIYGGFLFKHASYAVGGSDGTGYVRIARSLLHGGLVERVVELEQFNLPDEMLHTFIPLAYTPGTGARTMTPFYPVGVPLHMALGAALAGWDYGPFLVSPLAAVLSLVLIYLIGLELGLSRGFSMAGAMFLGAGASFIFMALSPMSDVVATCWALAAIWASLRSRKRDSWALLAGAAFGMAFLVRPINLMLMIPILFSLRLKPRTLLCFVLGGLPLAAIFFGYNTAAYGHPLRTGYAAIGLYNEIIFAGFTTRLGHYVYWLIMTMSPLILLGWLGVAVNRKVHWRIRAMLITWFGLFLLFYCCYSFYDTWWYTRFLLPGYPAMILGALLTGRSLVDWFTAGGGERRLVWGRRAALAILLAVVLGFELYYVRHFDVRSTGAVESMHSISCRMVEETAPPRALVVSMEMSGALKFYTGRPIVRWDLIEPDQWRLLKNHAGERSYQFYALLMEHELEGAQRRMPGKWTQLGTVRHISLWKIESASGDCANLTLYFGSL